MKALDRICLVLAVAMRATNAASLPRSDPEAQGVPSTTMLTFVNSLDQQIEGMHTSGVKDMQAVLNVIWDKLLPAMQPRELKLKTDTAASQQLKDRLARLVVHPAQGSATSPFAGRILNRKFVFPANDRKIETLALTSSDSGKTLTITAWMDGKEVTISGGYQEWKKARAPLLNGRLAQFPDEPTAGTFAWPTDDTCAIKLCAYETPFQTTFTLKFEGDQMTLNSEANVSFGPTKQPQLAGRAE